MNDIVTQAFRAEMEKIALIQQEEKRKLHPMTTFRLAGPGGTAIRAIHKKRSLEKKAEVEYRGTTFPGYNKPIPSTRKGKKKMVLVKKGDRVKVVHFGQKGYSDYTAHKDDARRKNYLARSGGIKNKDGKLTANDPFSPNYWARKVLW